MPSIESDFAQQLIAQGAPKEHIIFAYANIPQEFWTVTRKEIDITPTNYKAVEAILAFIDDRHNEIGKGHGLSLLGDPKSGKTLFGCAVLKACAVNWVSLDRAYDVWRGNYDTIIEDLYHLRGETEFGDYRNKLCRYDVLFIDSISPSAPPSSLLSILRTRRDFRKSTILATTLTQPQLEKTRALELFDIFRDVNQSWKLNR